MSLNRLHSFVYPAVAVVVDAVVNLGSAGVGLGLVVVAVADPCPAFARLGSADGLQIVPIAPPVPVFVQAVDDRFRGPHSLPDRRGGVAGVQGGVRVGGGNGGATGQKKIDERGHGEALS